jgi:hypothetical protein
MKQSVNGYLAGLNCLHAYQDLGINAKRPYYRTIQSSQSGSVIAKYLVIDPLPILSAKSLTAVDVCWTSPKS